MPYAAATGLFHPFKSLTCVHASLSCRMADNHSNLLLSSDTLVIWNPLVLCFFKTFISSEFSFLQGKHQLAQKSTKVYSPFVNNTASLPKVSCTWRFGAALPIAVTNRCAASLIISCA